MTTDNDNRLPYFIFRRFDAERRAVNNKILCVISAVDTMDASRMITALELKGIELDVLAVDWATWGEIRATISIKAPAIFRAAHGRIVPARIALSLPSPPTRPKSAPRRTRS